MQKTLTEMFTVDLWPQAQPISTGIERQAFYSYKLDPDEEAAALTFSEAGEQNQAGNPAVVLTEVARVSEASLNTNIAEMIVNVLSDREAVPVLADRLKEFCAELGIKHLMCHPAIEMPNGWHAVRHEEFPARDHEEFSTIFGCTENAGVIVKTPQGHSGGFILPGRFYKIRMEAPIRTVMDRLLDDDLLND